MVRKTVLLALLLLVGATLVEAKGGLGDPLRPLAGAAPSAAEPTVAAQKRPLELRLEAVLLSTERAVAIINGQSLQLGDRIDGFRLSKIAADRVELQKKQKKIVLRRTGTGLKKAFLSRDVGKGSQP